jgi:peptidoglycan/LPS O-acetylase OafA/YrhL
MREDVRSEVGDIPAIRGLRGVAVLWVVLFHYVGLREASGARDPWIEALRRVPALDVLVRNGYLGVDLFFLISGFLLALPWLVHARDGLAAPSAAGFYARRIRRIVPAYYAQLLVLFLVVLPLYLGPTYWRHDLYVYLWNGVAHGLFLQDTSPLTSGAILLNGALWTLPVEVQFYVLLPLAAPLFVRAPRAVLAAAIAFSLAWQWAGAHDLAPIVRAELALGAHWHWTEENVREILAMQLPAYLGHFALGIALGRAWLGARERIATRPRRIALAIAAFGAMLALAAALSDRVPVPHEHLRMAPALALAALLYAVVSSRGPIVRRIFARGPLAFAGDVSYSAYLYHAPILVLWSIHPSILRGWLSLPGMLAVIGAAAWISWMWVERPFLRSAMRHREDPSAGLAEEELALSAPQAPPSSSSATRP